MLSNFRILHTIGTGTFGTVKLGIHIPTEQKVAIKILDKSKISTKVELVRVKREIRILREVSHENIVNLYEIIDTKDAIYLIMEYWDGSDLSKLVKLKTRLNDEEAWKIFTQTLDAVWYLHSKQICHRDLKPENILIDENHNVKLWDFGLSNTYCDRQMLNTAWGSPSFAPPEMLSGNPYDAMKTDIWNLGIILYNMLWGSLPFYHTEIKKLYKQIRQGDYKIPLHVEYDAVDLINSMLNTDPKQRIEFDELRVKPWMKKHAPEHKKSSEKINRKVLLQVMAMVFLRRSEIVNLIKSNQVGPVKTMYYLLKKQQSQKSRKQSPVLTTRTKTQTFVSHRNTIKKFQSKRTSPVNSGRIPMNRLVFSQSSSPKGGSPVTSRSGSPVQLSKAISGGDLFRYPCLSPRIPTPPRSQINGWIGRQPITARGEKHRFGSGQKRLKRYLPRKNTIDN